MFDFYGARVVNLHLVTTGSKDLRVEEAEVSSIHEFDRLLDALFNEAQALWPKEYAERHGEGEPALEVRRPTCEQKSEHTSPTLEEPQSPAPAVPASEDDTPPPPAVGGLRARVIAEWKNGNRLDARHRRGAERLRLFGRADAAAYAQAGASPMTQRDKLCLLRGSARELLARQEQAEQVADVETRILKALRERLAAGDALGAIDLSSVAARIGVSRGIVADYVARFRKREVLR